MSWCREESKLTLGREQYGSDMSLAEVCGGFLVASGASRRHHWFRLSSSKLRPKEWLAEAQRVITGMMSTHIAL